jgi:hypothetical protein
VTIFDYLTDIVVSKTGTLTLDQYVPYMINKWLSFINPTVSQHINIFNNKELLENKEMHYKIMISFFPKMQRLPKLEYIKKIKNVEIEKDPRKSILAEQMELSIKEVEFLNNSLNELF